YQPATLWLESKERRMRPEETLEVFLFPMSFQDISKIRSKPATLWLANFLRRSATAARVLDGTSNIESKSPPSRRDPRETAAEGGIWGGAAAPPHRGQRETVTRRKVAGMRVLFLSGLWFWRLNKSSSSLCSSADLPFFSAAS